MLCPGGPWPQRTLTLLLHALGLQQLDLLLLPLAEHLLLEAGDRVQQLVPSHLGRWQHNAEVQEAVDGVQQVLPVVRQVGRLVEELVGIEGGGRRSHTGLILGVHTGLILSSHCIHKEFTLGSHWNHTRFRLGSHWVHNTGFTQWLHTAFKPGSYCIHTRFILHSHRVHTGFTLKSGLNTRCYNFKSLNPKCTNSDFMSYLVRHEGGDGSSNLVVVHASAGRA